MSNRAWMPLHIADYLADTGHLTATEHGAYMLLIMHYWQNGHLPANEKLIARVARMTADQWEESRDKLLSYFTADRGAYSRADKAVGRGLNRRAPVSMRRAALERDGEICAYCGAVEGPFHVDHKTPWSLGGRHDLDNLCVACEACNITKSNLPYSEWMEIIQ
jgi:hypothetical protein